MAILREVAEARNISPQGVIRGVVFDVLVRCTDTHSTVVYPNSAAPNGGQDKDVITRTR